MQLREENGGQGAGGMLELAGSICIWHTDCTKYANRQTMTFAVLFFLRYCNLSIVNRMIACVLLRTYLCVCWFSVCAPARCIHLYKSARRPRPCLTNHMKGSPLLRIALSKATLMFENGDGVSLKEQPTGVSVPGEG